MRKAVLLLLCALPLLAQDRPQPKLSNENLTPDEVAVYRAFLHSYDNGSKTTVNLANRTTPLALAKDDETQCLKGIELQKNLDEPKGTVHKLRAEDFSGLDLRLVDAEKQRELVKQNDPQNLVWRAVEEGAKADENDVKNAVNAAFASGLLELSEVAFDKKHQVAVMMFAFDCGRLCGNGALLVFKKVGGERKSVKGRTCAEWIS